MINFVLTGDRGSGYEILANWLERQVEVKCHTELLHPVSDVRKQAYRQYFGYMGEFDWYIPEHDSCQQFLTHKIWGKARNEEKAIGIAISYDEIASHHLFEYFSEMSKKGRLSFVHITRNPVACLLQWKRLENSLASPRMFLDGDKVVTAVRQHQIARRKLEACPDRLVIPWQELLLSFAFVRTQLVTYLEVNSSVGEASMGNIRPCRAADILNLERLRKSVPSDIAGYLGDSLEFFF